METKNIKIEDIKPHPRNPKMHETELITKSIKEMGYIEPIILDENNVILAGHGRLKALKELKKEEVEVVVKRGLTEKQKEKYLLLSNWDDEMLKDFDEDTLSEAGWESDEIDSLFEEIVEEDEFDADDEYEKITEPKTKVGDLYQLGEHRLICGDATKKEDVDILMDGKQARLIFTDPPYNVDYKSQSGLSYDSKKYGGSGGKIFNDDKSDRDCIKFYTDVLKNLYRISTDDVSIYWWFANKNNWINRLAFENANWHMSQIVIWLKNSMVFSRGQDYHRQYEPCMFGWKKKKVHYKNKRISNLKDVFSLDFDDFNEMLDVWYEKRDITSKYVHPTQKPVRLAERALRKNSERGDIVIDMFGGSGSTMMGCEQLNRKCFVMELDPKYCDVIVKRWEKFTGDKAELIRN